MHWPTDDQDFLHFFRSWIHVRVDVRSTTLRHGGIPLREALPESEFTQTMNGFSREEVAAAFDWAEQHASPGERDTIATACAMAHVHGGETETGKRLVESALASEYANSAAFQQLKEFTTRFGLVHWG